MVPAIPCDAGPLGILPEAELRDILVAPEHGTAWEESLPLLAGLALPEMTGGVNPGDQRALFHLVLALQPRAILEIGTHIGCSTVNLALALRRTGGRLLSVDVQDVNDPAAKPWLPYGASQSPRAACEKIGCDPIVKFQVADSLSFFRSCTETFDLIFLDGLHCAHQVYQEVPQALARLNRGGFIVLHDYFPALRPLWSNNYVIPGPFLAVQRLIDEGARLRSEERRVGKECRL